MERKPKQARGLVFVLAASACLAAALASCGTPGKDIIIHTPQLASIPDGVYRGKAESFVVKAEVEVTMESGRIRSGRVISHDCGKGRPAEAIVQTAVERQTLELDAVTGATLSSKVLLKAMEGALTLPPQTTTIKED